MFLCELGDLERMGLDLLAGDLAPIMYSTCQSMTVVPRTFDCVVSYTRIMDTSNTRYISPIHLYVREWKREG